MPPPPKWPPNLIKATQRYGVYRPTYEASEYGPINVIFRYIFPPDLGFLVRPVPRLSKLAHPNAGPKKAEIDSRGSFVDKNGHKAWEPDSEIAVRSEDNEYWFTVAVVEVKIAMRLWNDGCYGITKYLERLCDHRAGKAASDPEYKKYQDFLAVGLLIIGKVCFRCTYDTARGKAAVEATELGTLDDVQSPVVKLLYDLRERYDDPNEVKFKRKYFAQRTPDGKYLDWFFKYANRIKARIEAKEALNPSKDEEEADILTQQEEEDPWRTSVREATIASIVFEVLSHDFPTDGVLVKPQGPIRKLKSEDPKEHRPTLSKDSYTHDAGTEIGNRCDFLGAAYCDISDAANHVPEERLIFVCEVKAYRSTGNSRDLRAQLDKALERLYFHHKEGVVTGMIFLAVFGLRVWELKVEIKDEKASFLWPDKWDNKDAQDLFDHDDASRLRKEPDFRQKIKELL